MPPASTPNPLTPQRLSLAVALALSAWAAHAQTLEEVVVSASHQAQQSFDAPASIHAVGQEALEAAGPQINLSEAMNRVPGLAVLNRQNYAQDLQMSVRGAGARTPFGIRGVRLIVDGIPATMPDGQGQAATLSLPSTQRIEVLRGPLAQLYGNAAGGVVQAFSRDGSEPPQLRFGLDTGADNLRRLGLQLTGRQGRFDYLIDRSDMRTDGWRDHSAARRQHTNARLRWQASEDTRLTVVANLFDQPHSQDPLGLTRAQWEANPRQADARATQFQSGKVVSQEQVGLVVDHRFDAQRELQLRVHTGRRDLDNRLAIPLAAQNAPTSAGGVVQLDRRFDGFGLRHTQRLPLGDGQLQWTVGADHEAMTDRRQGFMNQMGVQGALKRDEDNLARANGAFVQADWAISERWSAIAGLRHHRVNLSVRDRFIRPSNPDDSGAASYHATNPVLGLTRHLSEDTNLYANLGRGFETPTLTEVAYRAGGSGLNLGLQAARSTHLEAGLKTRLSEHQRLDLALFRIDTRDEIVVASSSGGRTLYTNAGRTRRQGLELTHSARWAPAWRTHVALSTLQARFVDPFASAGGAPVAAGNRLPGVPDRSLFAELAWQSQGVPGLTAAVEVMHQGRIMVDDLNSDRAPAVTLMALRLGYERQAGPWRLRANLRLDNATDKTYAGSVIVNESNRRFFEPAPGRQWSLGLSATYVFR